MFINESVDNKNNICGNIFAEFRTSHGISQRKLAERLQLLGLNIVKNAVLRIKMGQRLLMS